MAVSSAGVAVPVPGTETTVGKAGSSAYPFAWVVAVDDDDTERELVPGRTEGDGLRAAGFVDCGEIACRAASISGHQRMMCRQLTRGFPCQWL